MTDVSFIPVSEHHRPLLKTWLSAAHVRAWWGETESELALIYDGKGEHEPFIAFVDSEPVAYIQAWWPGQHPDLGWQRGMDSSTRGIDLFIGEDKNTGRGLGAVIIKDFAARLFGEGAQRLVIDPDSRNARAIACYKKVGFTPYGTFEKDGDCDLLMELRLEDFRREHAN